MRRLNWLILVAALACLAGCEVVDENPHWSPKADYPAWAYDAPWYYRPTQEMQPLEHIMAGQQKIPVYFTRSDSFFVVHPTGYQVNGDPRIAIWDSSDAGKNWERSGYFGVEQTHFLFKAPKDGCYWIRFVGPNQGSTQVPPGVPNRIYNVDTKPPKITLTVTPAEFDDKDKKEPHFYAIGDEITVHWMVEDVNLDAKTVKLQTCFTSFPDNMIWSQAPGETAPEGQIKYRIPPQAAGNGGMAFRVEATDKAGNVGAGMTETMHVLKPRPPAVEGVRASVVTTRPADAKNVTSQPVDPSKAAAAAVEPVKATTRPVAVTSKPATKPAAVTSKPTTKPAAVAAKPTSKPAAVASKPATKPVAVTSKPAAPAKTTAHLVTPATKPAAKPVAAASQPVPAAVERPDVVAAAPAATPAPAAPAKTTAHLVTPPAKAANQAATPSKVATQPAPTAKPTPAPTPAPTPKPAPTPTPAPTVWPTIANDPPTPDAQGWPSAGSLIRGNTAAVLTYLPRGAKNRSNLELMFSTDNGQTWRCVWASVGTAKGKTGAINWTVPAVSSKDCRLRIVSLGNDGAAEALATSERFTVDTVQSDSAE